MEVLGPQLCHKNDVDAILEIIADNCQSVTKFEFLDAYVCWSNRCRSNL
jgi:hypothetical protein